MSFPRWRSRSTVKETDQMTQPRSKKSAAVWLSIGANQGDRLAALRGAVHLLEGHPDIELTAVSSLYETDPVGPVPQPDFYNAVIGIRTSLSPIVLLDYCQSIERRYHRRRLIRWGPRTLDIDLLTYDDLSLVSPRLTLPHPEMDHRAFVQIPLAEVCGKPLPIDDSVRLIRQNWYDAARINRCNKPGEHP